MKINFILGAGFSIPCGYPSGGELNQKFSEGVENRLLKMSDGIWFWDEHGEANSINGKLNGDWRKFSYLLAELIERFQYSTSLIFDYEIFYNWLLELGQDDYLIEFGAMIKNANQRILDDGFYEQFEFSDQDSFLKIVELYNYLIADVLKRPYNRESNISIYDTFINSIKNSHESNIFTLNHDLLVEYLLERNDILYSDGFNSINSELIGVDETPLEVYNESYGCNIRLFKLHGSVNYHKFSFASEVAPGQYMTKYGNLFFKPKKYRDVFYAKRIDKTTKKEIQNHSFDSVLPQFITGTSKNLIIEKEYIYGTLFNYFKHGFSGIQYLIIIGYSYKDVHINKIIKENIDLHDFEVININPFRTYPFRRKFDKKNIINLNTIPELEKILK